jgi:hypothetical protein
MGGSNEEQPAMSINTAPESSARCSAQAVRMLQWQQQQVAFSNVNCCVAESSLVAMAAAAGCLF